MKHNSDVQADAHFMPFVNGGFDTVWCVAVLLYCQSPVDVVREASRVLRPGGYLVVYEPFNLVPEMDGDWQRLTPAGLKRLGEMAKLETVEIRSCGGMLSVMLQAANDQCYYRAGRGHYGKFINMLLSPFLPILLSVDDRFCQRDADYARYSTGWIYVGQKRCT
ncbi:MAG: methyltransferase domain-containing protein [Planctomycetota bacterium]